MILKSSLRKDHGCFDLRVSFNPLDGKVYLTHSVICMPCEEGLKILKKVAEKNPEEIIIVNMKSDHDVTTQTKEGVKEVARCIETLGRTLVRAPPERPHPSLDYTLDEAKKTGQNVLVTWQVHNKELAIDGVEHLDRTREKWFNSQTVQELEGEVKKHALGPYEYASYSLTPNVNSVTQEVVSAVKSLNPRRVGIIAAAKKVNESYIRNQDNVSGRGVVMDSPDSRTVATSIRKNFVQKEKERATSRESATKARNTQT
jgi:hypothetical protein